MAVSFTAGHFNSAVNQASVASFNISLTTTSDRCGLVAVCTYANSGNPIDTGVTLGGVSMALVSGGAASDTATEPGHVRFYFLDNITAGAGTTVTVSRTNNAVVCSAGAWGIAAASACEVYTTGIQLVNDNAAYSEKSVDDGSPGTNSLRFACGYYGGATPAGVGANTTSDLADDRTAFGCSWGHETTAGQGSRSVGFSNVTSDDQASVHLAVRETPAATPVIPNVTMAPIGSWR